MDILERMDNILDEADKIPKALKSWVADYIIALDDGKERQAKEMKKDIESEAKMVGLDPKDVFSVFGNLGNKREFKKAVDKASRFQSVGHL